MQVVNDTFDLAPYFARVGYNGSRAPTVDVLHALTEAHTQAIPFENIDVLLDRPIRLETEALFTKLVLARRGGYCFEQNGWFLAVLRQMGFDVRALGACVRLGEPDRRVPMQRTHVLLEVRFGDAAWITDVGVGSASLTRALRLVAGREQATPHEPRRLDHAGGRWYHQIRRGGAWVDVCEFTGEEMSLPDRRVANWYTSTHPDSVFRRQLSVSLARPHGERLSVHDAMLTRRRADGREERQAIDDHDGLLDVLRTHFGIVLPDGTRLPVAFG